jgi:hypothetical protein
MNKIDEIVKRFKEIAAYNPKKGIIIEGFGDADINGYVCVGEVPFWPWGSGGDKLYIMVDPQKSMKYGEMVNDIRYTENADGSGRQTSSIPSFARKNITIYPEHQDDELGELFLGKRKNDEQAKELHKQFVSKLFKIENNVVLHHNSSYKITDGVIKKGIQNNWSNNGDIGIYFWGSRNSGNDQSNVSTFTYYCIIPLSDLYDFQTNVERLSLEQALRKYNYAGQFWKNTDSIVINTFKPTPIWCILDKDNGKWYDKEWNEIEKPF